MSNKAKVRLFVARDLISILLFLQILVAALGAVVFAIDQATGYNILKEISEEDAKKISKGDAKVKVMVYYLCGLVALLALLGLSTLLGVCCCCCCSSNVCQSDDNDSDCYCCWWGYPCYPSWYCSHQYYPHGAGCCSVPVFDCVVCAGDTADCHGGNRGCGGTRVMIILFLVVVAILAILGFLVMVYVLAIVGQRLFQRRVEILARQEACRQQEIVDLSEIDMSQIEEYAVVNLEPSAPPEPDQDSPSQVAPSASPRYMVNDTECREDEPLLPAPVNS